MSDDALLNGSATEAATDTSARNDPASEDTNADKSIEGRMYPDDASQKENTKPESDSGKLDGEKKDNEKEGEKSKEPDKIDPLNQVPEDGVYDLKMPEGMELDEKTYEEFSPVLKEAGVTLGNAQKLTDAYITTMQRVVAANQIETRARNMTQWAKDAKTDPEIGGTNFNANVQVANGVLKRFGSEGLVAALDESGLGNHPEMIRLFTKIGNEMSEDIAAKGKTSSSQPSIEDRLFPPSLMSQITHK